MQRPASIERIKLFLLTGIFVLYCIFV